MRFIQTFYCNPLKDLFTDGCGWVRPEFNLMSWALSCLQLKKYYGEVELYTDDRIAKIFIDDLKLPYTRVHTVFNDFDKIDDRLWALPKIYTYSLQDSPFLHVDGDIFLFDKLPEELLKSELIGQNKEVATGYYVSKQKLLLETLSYFPDYVKKDFNSKEPISAVNAGIFGGSDVKFFQEYTKEAYQYVLKNKNELKGIDANIFNVFFEQHLFYALTKERGKEVSYLFYDVFDDIGYRLFGNFYEVPIDRTYIHLLGGYKQEIDTCIQLANKLRELYPEYYYRIVKLFKDKGLDFYSDFYKDKSVETEQEYTSLDAYSKGIFLGDIVVANEEGIGHGDRHVFIDELNKKLLAVVPKGQCTNELAADLNEFDGKLSNAMARNVSEHYLYGRDILSSSWIYKMRLNQLNSKSVLLKQTNGLSIIESKYNWAGLFNKYYRRGVEYYEKLDVEEGNFYSLVVPELSPTVCLLYDLDEFEKLVLEFLSQEHSLDDLLKDFEQYIDEDVLRNDYDMYKSYIMSIVTRLVTCKAIYPTNIDYDKKVKNIG